MRALPFPCIRPVPEHAAEVAALPYDVFSRAEAAVHVAGRPLSFLNIDRPETQFGPEQDMYAPEVYARGAELLRERVEDGTLIEDRNLSYYIYRLVWEGRAQTGIACVCAVDEFESGVIKRHELTREDKELDRVKHIRALGCQTGPIFLTYRDQPVLDMIVGAAMKMCIRDSPCTSEITYVANASSLKVNLNVRVIVFPRESLLNRPSARFSAMRRSAMPMGRLDDSRRARGGGPPPM